MIDAVLALSPPASTWWCQARRRGGLPALPEAEALAAANKRIVNILKKAEARRRADVALLQDAEKALFRHRRGGAAGALPLPNEDYTGCAARAGRPARAVDQFFEDVMVMAEEPLVRQNRLALLAQLAGLMNQVADISRLSA